MLYKIFVVSLLGVMFLSGIIGFQASAEESQFIFESPIVYSGSEGQYELYVSQAGNGFIEVTTVK